MILLLIAGICTSQFTILKNSNVVTQGAFFEQCFKSESNLLPINDKFSKVINTPGSYDLVVDMISKDLSNISTSGLFTVK